jgi:hypothetical protein
VRIAGEGGIQDRGLFRNSRIHRGPPNWAFQPGGSEDPWPSGVGFRRVWLFRCTTEYGFRNLTNQARFSHRVSAADD